MASAAAKVIIDAEDLASKKMALAAANTERSIKQIKDVGGKAKASTEFIGTLANTLGGSAFGSYAGQLAQLTERVSAFSEVSKAGGAGALAFKAGLAGAVGVMAFQFGKELNKIIFGTSEVEKQLHRAKEAAEEFKDAMLAATSRRVDHSMEDIELIRDPEEKRAAQEALLQQLDRDVAGITSQLEASRKAAEEWADAWKLTPERTEMAEMAQKEFELDKERLRQAKQLRDMVRDQYSERRRINEQIKADNAAAEQAERDALQAKEEAEKAAADAAEKARQAQIEAAERLADIVKRETDRLKEQRLELEKGKEAAKAFRLEQEGLDKATASRLAKEQAEIDRIREEKEESDRLKNLPDQQIGTQAVQSRLLTRGPAERGIDKIAKSSEQTVSKLDQVIEALKAKSRETLEVELLRN